MNQSDNVTFHLNKRWVLAHSVFGLLVLLFVVSLAVLALQKIVEVDTWSGDTTFGAFALILFLVLFGPVVFVAVLMIFRALFSSGPAFVLDPYGIRVPLYGEERIPWPLVYGLEAGLHSSSNKLPWNLFRYPVRVHIDDMIVIQKFCASLPVAFRWIAYGHAWVVMKLRGYYTFELSGYWIAERVEDAADDIQRIASAADPRFGLNDE